MNIDTIPAGRELDALVAEKVMGRRWMTFIHQSYLLLPEVIEHVCFRGSSWTPGKTAEWDEHGIILRDIPQQEVPHYSTDIAAAWQVLQKLKWFTFIAFPDGKPEKTVYDVGVGLTDGEVYAHAETAPLAICRAALKAVGA